MDKEADTAEEEAAEQGQASIKKKRSYSKCRGKCPREGEWNTLGDEVKGIVLNREACGVLNFYEFELKLITYDNEFKWNRFTVIHLADYYI